jgi:hypothetical protein
LFGDPSETLAAEAVWIFHREEGGWPSWDYAVESIAVLASIESREAAESRLATAIAAEEVEVMAVGRGKDFLIAISQATQDRITCRHMDVTMPRRDKSERW